MFLLTDKCFWCVLLLNDQFALVNLDAVYFVFLFCFFLLYYDIIYVYFRLLKFYGKYEGD